MIFVRFSVFVVISFWLFVVSVPAARRPPWNGDGRYRKAFVVDSGLSALRRSPSPSSTCLRRLRLGRSLYVISTHKGQDGIGYYFVAVTRRTRGYIDRAAVASPAQRGDDARLMRLIEEAEGIDQITLCRLLVTQFASSRFCPDALLIEGMAAEGMARELSRRVARRPPRRLDKELMPERYLLNYSGLDRYSRLGIGFRIIDESFHYDGAAYRRILNRYPRSQAAQTARERLEEIREADSLSSVAD
jgi:hypothetical protein